MSRHDPTVYMRHMLDNARNALALVEGRDRSDLDDMGFRFSVLYAVSIIGEAAGKVPAEVRSQYPQIPWRKIVDLRNRLIHGYDYVDKDILWDVVSNMLSPLIASLEAILPPWPEA